MAAPDALRCLQEQKSLNGAMFDEASRRLRSLQASLQRLQRRMDEVRARQAFTAHHLQQQQQQSPARPP